MLIAQGETIFSESYEQTDLAARFDVMETKVSLIADLNVGAAMNFKNTNLAPEIGDQTEEFCGQREGQLF